MAVWSQEILENAKVSLIASGGWSVPSGQMYTIGGAIDASKLSTSAITAEQIAVGSISKDMLSAGLWSGSE